MRHIVTSETGKPGMTLDQLQEAIEQARRAGATGGEVVHARLYGRRGGLRSVTVELDRPLGPDTRSSVTVARPKRGRRGQTAAPDQQSDA